jgi:hypothetical protein
MPPIEGGIAGVLRQQCPLLQKKIPMATGCALNLEEKRLSMSPTGKWPRVD